MKALTKLFIIAIVSALLTGQLTIDVAQSKYESAQQLPTNAVGQFASGEQPPNVVIEGSVTDEKGALLRNVPVILEYERESLQTRTDEFGKYKFDKVNPSLDYALIIRYNTTAGLELNKFKEVKIRNRVTTVNLQLTFESTPMPSPTPRPSVTAKPTPIRRPSPVATPVSSPTPGLNGTDWEAKIQEGVRRLRDGNIVFNPHTEMKEQKPETVQARISFQDIGPALAHKRKSSKSAR